MYGSNYVPMPYSPVEAYSASNDAVIPSGGTIVGNVYYEWNIDSGFLGNGWYTNIKNGPTAIFTTINFDDPQAVTDYINEKGNLNEVFANWGEYLKSLPFDDADAAATEFKDAVAAAGNNCVHY